MGRLTHGGRGLDGAPPVDHGDVEMGVAAELQLDRDGSAQMVIQDVVSVDRDGLRHGHGDHA